MWIIHADVNALNFAHRDVTDCTIYVSPMPPCSRCASQIIQRGIKRIVSYTPTNDALSRWGKDFKISEKMYSEVNIELILVN